MSFAATFTVTAVPDGVVAASLPNTGATRVTLIRIVEEYVVLFPASLMV